MLRRRAGDRRAVRAACPHPGRRARIRNQDFVMLKALTPLRALLNRARVARAETGAGYFRQAREVLALRRGQGWLGADEYLDFGLHVDRKSGRWGPIGADIPRAIAEP
jgi:hypothetical protein